jgi:hypothetical protein
VSKTCISNFNVYYVDLHFFVNLGVTQIGSRVEIFYTAYGGIRQGAKGSFLNVNIFSALLFS